MKLSQMFCPRSDTLDLKAKNGINMVTVPDWWKTVRYFHPSEFDSPDQPGSGSMMERGIIQALDIIREGLGRPLVVNSGFRTASHNATLPDSSKDSSHIRGWAVDLSVRDSRTRSAVLSGAHKVGIVRIGIGKTMVHLDMDPALPQWVIWLY